MTLSWSHKLFLRINGFVGRVPALDTAMVVVAHGLVYIVIGGTIVAGMFLFPEDEVSVYWYALLAAYTIGYAMNYTIAIFYRHQRPVKELPNIRVLVRTLGTWKSFPSDHAMTAAIPVTLVLLRGLSVGMPWQWALPSFLGALLVGFSRVYVGVHYPRDIIGGFVVGGISALLAYSVVFS